MRLRKLTAEDVLKIEAAIKALKDAGAIEMRANYDGGIGIGGVVAVTALNHTSQIDVPDEYYADLCMLGNLTLEDAIVDWNLGDGGYGIIEMNLIERTATIRHTKRVQELRQP